MKTHYTNSFFTFYNLHQQRLSIATLASTILLLFLLIGFNSMAQVFLEIPRSGTGMSQAEAVWIASGNKLHPIASGEISANSGRIRTIFHQQKSKNNFVATQANLPDFSFGAMDAADFNKDGLEDVVLTGIGNGNKYLSGIYQRQSNGTFQRSNQQLPALADGSVQFGDYDKDGDLDVLISGKDGSGVSHTKIFRNDNGKLVEIKTSLPGIRFGKAAWGDFTNDGLLDIILTGQSKDGLITKVFIQKNGNFSPLRQHFTPLYHSDVVCTDFNNDGQLDFMVAGQGINGNPVTRYYLGSKSQQFTDGNPKGIRQLMHASLDAGDYNGDGFVDIVITGESLERPYTIVLQNVQGKGFKDMMAGLPGVSNGVARWGDYDNDGDLDLYIAGLDVCFNLIGSVYRCTLDPIIDTEESPIETIPLELAAGPKYYFVFSSCYCDPEKTGKKSYHGFVSNIHKEKMDFDLNYEFNHLLITNYPGWNMADRGHRTSNAFTSVQDAEKGRKTVIASYLEDKYTVHYLNW
jgi:hypothetical protein